MRTLPEDPVAWPSTPFDSSLLESTRAVILRFSRIWEIFLGVQTLQTAKVPRVLGTLMPNLSHHPNDSHVEVGEGVQNVTWQIIGFGAIPSRTTA